MFLVCTIMLLVYSRMLLVCTRMLLVCTRMLLVCTRMFLVCSFSHDLKIDHCLNYRMRPTSSLYHDVFPTVSVHVECKSLMTGAMILQRHCGYLVQSKCD